MESQRGRQPTVALIVGAIGAIALIVSPFLKWIVIQMDLSGIIDSLGLPAGTEIPGFEGTFNIVSGDGFEDQVNGWVSLAGGVVALAGIVLVLVRLIPRSAAAYIALAGGLLGGLWALYDGLVRFDDLLQEELARDPGLALGSDLPPGITAEQVKNALSAPPQIGVWVAALGGALVVIAALLVMTSRDVAADAAGDQGLAGGGPGLGAPASGFGTAPVTPGGSTPPTSAVPPAETAPPPSAPPSTAPDPIPPAPREDPPASTP